MQNYLNLLKTVMDAGVDRNDRTGIGSRFINGAMLKWDLSKGFPLQTTRKVPLRFAFEETMFFLRGETNTKILEQKNINIWKGNTTREFLDNRGLHDLPEGSIGTGYSHAWRNFGGTLGNSDGVDQIKELLGGIKIDPNGRRHLVTAWNPQQNSGTPLPPCHIMHMYSVMNNKLNSSFVMRSNDLPFGLPFNIAGYALLNHIFAKHLGLEPGELTYMGWDAHIYMNQIEMSTEILTRTPKELPTLSINKDLITLEDIMSLQWEDITLSGYDPYPDVQNKPEMAK
jgi:thymidylate synthase